MNDFINVKPGGLNSNSYSFQQIKSMQNRVDKWNKMW